MSPSASPSATTGPQDGPALTSRHRIRDVGVASCALLLLVAVVLARPGGSLGADDTEHVAPLGVAGPLGASSPVRQAFIGGDDGLSRVAVRLSSSGPTCTVVAALRRSGERVAEQRTPCGRLGASTLVDVVRIDPVEDSGGTAFTLELRATGTDEVFVGTGSDGPDGLPPAAGGAIGPDLSVELHSDYGEGGRAAGQVGTAIDRMSEGRPWWQQPIPLVLTAVVAAGGLVGLAVARGRAATWLLVTFVVAKGLVWTAIIPPFQSPDEPAHYAYAQFLAHEHRLPERDIETIDEPLLYSPQVHRLSDLAHVFAAAEGDRFDYSPGAVAQLEALGDLSPESVDPNGNGAAAGYPPVYYLGGAALYALGPDRVDHSVQVVRWTSIGFGVALALACRALGRRLFGGSDAVGLALAVAVSAQPMISQQSATVNNDAMVLAVGAWALVAAVELLRPVGERWPRLAFWATFAVGGSMLAKNFAAGFAGVVFLGWLIGRRRTPRAERPPVWREAALAAAGLACTVGAWMAITVLSGFESAALADFEEASRPLSVGDYLQALRAGDFALVRENMIPQLWGDFGWLRAPLPETVQHVVAALLVLAAAVSAVWLLRLGVGVVRRRTGEWSEVELAGASGGLLMAAAVAATLVLLYGVQLRIYQQSGGLYILQGRYFLVMLPALFALPILAVQGLLPAHRIARTATGVAAASVVLQVVSIAVVIEHFYL